MPHNLGHTNELKGFIQAVCHDGFFIWINEKAVCRGRRPMVGFWIATSAEREKGLPFLRKARARQRARGRRKTAQGERVRPLPFLASAARRSSGGRQSAAPGEAVTYPRKVTVQVRRSTCTQRGPEGRACHFAGSCACRFVSGSQDLWLSRGKRCARLIS